MEKKGIIATIIGALIFSFVYGVNAQTDIKNMEKTITLPNGEVVLDMDGEWEKIAEYKGMFSGLRSHKDIVTIKQDGKKFNGIMKTSNEWHSAGAIIIMGELDSKGFKSVEINRADVGWVPCKWKILEAGNKIIFDDERVVELTYIRE